MDNPALAKSYKSQLSLTNQCDALHHGKCAVNKGGSSCDEFVTELG